MKKKIFILIFALFLSVNFSSAFFADVSEDHEYFEAIDYASKEKIINGYSDGTYRPDKEINRAEFLTIIVNSLFKKEDIKGESCFSDVDKEWFSSFVCFAKEKEIVSGYKDGSFRPQNKINFAEASAIIVNAFGFKTEKDEVWFKPFVEKLSEKKAIPESILSFNSNITRGEMAEIVYRLRENIEDKNSLIFEDLEGPNFKINDLKIENDTYVVEMNASRVNFRVLTGFDSIRPEECDYPHHCKAESKAEDFLSFVERSNKDLLISGPFFDAYSSELNGTNYHTVSGDIIISGEMRSMYGWDHAHGNGGMIAQKKDGSFEFYFPIREWIYEDDEINSAVSNFPLVLLNGKTRTQDEISKGISEEELKKFWIAGRRGGLGFSEDKKYIYYVNVLGTVIELGEELKKAGAQNGFALDAGGSNAFYLKGQEVFLPSRKLTTVIEFYEK